MKAEILAILLIVGTLLVCLSRGAQQGTLHAASQDSVLTAPLGRPLSDARGGRLCRWLSHWPSQMRGVGWALA